MFTTHGKVNSWIVAGVLLASTLFNPAYAAGSTNRTQAALGASPTNPIPHLIAAPEGSEYLTRAVLEHRFQHGPDANDDLAGVAYDPTTNTFWAADSGSSQSIIYQYAEDGSILTTGAIPADPRALVYRPEDGQIYLSSYRRDVYRLNLPFDGTVTLLYSDILQDDQAGIAFADGGNIFDVLDGQVREYDFATGQVLRTFRLQPPYPSARTYPYNVNLASDGDDLYFLSSPDDVYIYDLDGNLKARTNLNHPSFDTVRAPLSFSYAHERIYVHEREDHYLYGFRIKASDSVMHVASIDPFYTPQPSGNLVGAGVTIHDQNNQPVPQATVLLQVTLPRGRSFPTGLRTHLDGSASVSGIISATGTFTFTVFSVRKLGFDYNPAQNIESTDSITVP